MPGENIQDWSITAANNSNADTSIDWAEGQPRASVNNSGRAMMAAHAKDRNLQNGSIVTGGTANALTFTSGVGYILPIPTGLRVLLKIGVGPKNTGATTLNMDGIADTPVKDQSGNALLGGELLLGNYAEFLYDGTNWVLLYRPGSAGGEGGGGILKYISATALSYLPFMGATLKIGGVTYDIPITGVVGLANTGTFVNGVAASSLAANTTYYLYAFNNSGIITADFSTTGRSTSATTGNVGIEIKTGDDSRSLIGIVRTNASAQFVDSTTQRFVRSWFNRATITGKSTISADAATQLVVHTDLDTTRHCEFLAWLDEVVCALAVGVCVTSSLPPHTAAIGVALNGASNTIPGALPEAWVRILEQNIAYGSCMNGGSTPILVEGYNYTQTTGRSVTGGVIIFASGWTGHSYDLG